MNCELEAHNWGYDAHNGPHSWSKICPNAGGHKQSPINLTSEHASSDSVLLRDPVRLVQTKSENISVSNTSTNFMVKMDTDATVTGGPMGTDVYAFEQFHAHWGRESEWGSEHTLDGRRFSGELHFVFWNTKYPSFSEATQHTDGLAVLGRFMEQHESDGQECEELKEVTNALRQIRFADDQPAKLLKAIHLPLLLPGDLSGYYTYEGSLTTPPCCECVTWIVFTEPIKFSASQMEACRSLRISRRGDVLQIPCFDNFRPPCPSANRVLRKPY